MTVHLVDPHLSATGGCRCDCEACIAVRGPKSIGGLYQRVCICPECSQDCPSMNRGARDTELGAIEPHTATQWPPRHHCGCQAQRDGYGCCWCGRRQGRAYDAGWLECLYRPGELKDHPAQRVADSARALGVEYVIADGRMWKPGTPTPGVDIVQSPSEPLTTAPAYDLPEHSPVQAVVRAWTVYGRRPDVHRQAMAQLRRDWPVLAGALDRLAGAPPEDPRVLLRATPGHCSACGTAGDVCRYSYCIRCHVYDCERSSHVDGPHRRHYVADRRGHRK